MSPAGGAAVGHPPDLLQWDAPRLMGLGDFARADPEGRQSDAAGENEGGEDRAVQQARALEQAEAELLDVAPPLIGVPPQRAEQGLLASGLQALVSSLPMARSLYSILNTQYIQMSSYSAKHSSQLMSTHALMQSCPTHDHTSACSDCGVQYHPTSHLSLPMPPLLAAVAAACPFPHTFSASLHAGHLHNFFNLFIHYL